jgi:putative ABC transport system permease protein
VLPGWFLAAWGREVTDLLRTEESAARSRGHFALLRFRVATTADLLRAAWQTRGQAGAGLPGDVRLALRQYRRSPGFTFFAVISLAIGVAMSATAFSVLDPAFFRPLPFPQADKLVSVRVVTVQDDVRRTRYPSYTQFRAWQALGADQLASTDAVVAYQARWQQQVAPGGVEDPRDDLLVQTVTPGFLSLLGARTSIGRGLTLEDHRAGAPPVVVITDSYWQRRLGARADVVSTIATVRGAPYTIIGVLAPDFRFGAQVPDMIRPTVPGPNTQPEPGDLVEVIARLREDATIDRLAAEFGTTLRGDDALVEPIRSHLYGWAPAVFGPFAGAAAFLLLLVIANVANLTLVRATGRRQEMALRTALGAGRGQIARLVIVEAILLTVVAGALGLLFTWWTIDVLTRLNPMGVAGMNPLFDARTVVFGGAVALVTGALAALWPNLTVIQRELPTALRQGPQQGTGSSRQRLSQRALVMCQIACALVVLTGAGLLIKTIYRMQSYDPGIDTRHLLTAYVEVSPTSGDGRSETLVLDQLLDGLRAIPGVSSAGLINVVGPPAGGTITVQSVRDEVRPASMAYTDRIVQTSPGYFEALGLPVVQGRMLTPDEFRGGQQVALVNEEAARRWWFGRDDIIGSRIRVDAADSSAPWATIVGIVRNTGSLTVQSLAWDRAARIYLPFTNAGHSMILYARTSGDPLGVLPALHARAVELDRGVRILMPADAKAALESEVSHHRVTADLVGGLAAFGLLLASMGIYGVTTYAVARRTREIGIRKALGAGPGHVLLTVSREAAGLALGGITIGLAVSAGVTRMLETMLYGTSPLDPVVFACASLLIVCIVAIATYVPVRNALRVDPMTSLRCE